METKHVFIGLFLALVVFNGFIATGQSTASYANTPELSGEMNLAETEPVLVYETGVVERQLQFQSSDGVVRAQWYDVDDKDIVAETDYYTLDSEWTGIVFSMGDGDWVAEFRVVDNTVEWRIVQSSLTRAEMDFVNTTQPCSCVS